MSEWIPVKERLPEDYDISEEKCIICTEDGEIHIALCYHNGGILGSPCWFGEFGVLEHVVAWMPSPEPYREEDGT